MAEWTESLLHAAIRRQLIAIIGEVLEDHAFLGPTTGDYISYTDRIIKVIEQDQVKRHG